MAHIKRFAAVAAAALTLAAGASNAMAYNPEHPNPIAVAKCQANVEKQFDKALSGGNGAKSGSSGDFAPTNCNKFFGTPGKR